MGRYACGEVVGIMRRSRIKVREIIGHRRKAQLYRYKNLTLCHYMYVTLFPASHVYSSMRM